MLPTVLLLLQHISIARTAQRTPLPVTPLLRTTNLLPSNGACLQSPSLATAAVSAGLTVLALSKYEYATVLTLKEGPRCAHVRTSHLVIWHKLCDLSQEISVIDFFVIFVTQLTVSSRPDFIFHF
jgi:hypothetical protein